MIVSLAATRYRICCKNNCLTSLQVRQVLVADRRSALLAIRQGFSSLQLADHLEHFSGLELATLFFGEQYIDADALVKSFVFEEVDAQSQTGAWLHQFVRQLSESSIRVFLARVTNKLTLPQQGQRITVDVDSASEQPAFFPVACHMQLPHCSSFAIFASRMGEALHLGDCMVRTGTQEEQRLSKEEERTIAAAMGDGIRAGGYYKCVCGYIYAVGECGGPMQVATCPKCGQQIGGSQHRLQNGNQHACFDGAVHAAWPQA